MHEDKNSMGNNIISKPMLVIFGKCAKIALSPTARTSSAC